MSAGISCESVIADGALPTIAAETDFAALKLAGPFEIRIRPAVVLLIETKLILAFAHVDDLRGERLVDFEVMAFRCIDPFAFVIAHQCLIGFGDFGPCWGDSFGGVDVGCIQQHCSEKNSGRFHGHEGAISKRLRPNGKQPSSATIVNRGGRANHSAAMLRGKVVPTIRAARVRAEGSMEKARAGGRRRRAARRCVRPPHRSEKPRP